MQSGTDILFVVVLYNQIFKDTNVYKSLLNRISTRNIFIWDNSTSSELNNGLDSSGFQYVYSLQNRGVSFSYNKAFEYADQKGFQWMVLLDQDTIFSDTFLEKLRLAMYQHPEIRIFCPLHQLTNGLYLSPVKFFMRFTRLSKKRISGVINITEYAIINSGLVVSVDLFKKVGGYNEKVFLDYSDFQFLKRCTQVDTKAFCIASVCIQDFSDNCIDKEKLLNRFSLFCQSLKGYENKTIGDTIECGLVVLKRCLSLAYRLKSFQPFEIYYNQYIK